MSSSTESTGMASPSGEQRREITIAPEEAGERLDRVLTAHIAEVSRSRIKALIESGCLSLDGETIVEPSYRVKPAQTFRLVIPEIRPARPEAEAVPLDVRYEDAALIVIEKPAGMVVHPAPGNPDKTLVNALIGHCGDTLRGIGGERRPGIVHRLDKDTSGLMVAAKTEPALRSLSQQFAARSVDRAYRAVVWGLPSPTQGEITGSIGRSPRNRKKMAVVSRGGKPATTRYRVLESLAGGAASLVECRLLTGRTHQIRVHLTEAGHALIGDPLYGRASQRKAARLRPEAAAAAGRFPRQALHAGELGFEHPKTGEWLQFTSGLPDDMQTLIAALQKG